MDHFKPFNRDDSPPQPPEEPQDDSDLDEAPTGDEKQARLEYLKSISHKPKSKRKLLLILLTVLVVLLLAGGAYMLTKKPKAAAPLAKKTTSTQQVAPSAESDSSTASAPGHYVSNGKDLNLSFDYPSSWSVTPTSGDNAGDKTITLSSPLVTIPSAAGGSVTGKVTVTLRPASAGLTELSSGKATAAQTSVQFAYSKPTPAQFQYPFLAFIHLVGGANPTSAFEEVLISGTRQINKGDSITTSTITPDPIISTTFYSCATPACTGTGAVALGITNDTWLNTTIFQQTLSLFESLQIN